MFDNPIMIGGGVKHSAEAVRNLAYNATGGGEGVGAPLDLKVRPLSPQAGFVSVAPGGVTIRQRASNAPAESYTARNLQEMQVAIPASTTNTRSWLIVVSVDDPFVDGSHVPEPADVDSAEYVSVQVVGPVSQTVTSIRQVSGWANRSAYAVAIVVVPPNTSSVSAGMIKDLRQLANPRFSMFAAVAQGSGGGTSNPLTGESITTWTGAPTLQVPVPDWANFSIVDAQINSASLRGTGTASQFANGRVRGWFAGGVTYETVYDYEYAGKRETPNLAIAGEIPLAADRRGTTQTFDFQGSKAGGAATLYFNNGATSIVKIMFMERVE